MSTSEAFNFKKINEQVATSGLLSQDHLNALGREGYRAVINLLPQWHDYAVQDEQAIVEVQGVAYHYIPVDFDAPTEADYLEFEDTLLQLADAKVLLHCAANYRVSAFYGIYAVRHLGWSKREAMQHIASIWTLQEYPVWQAFVTDMLDDAQA